MLDVSWDFQKIRFERRNQSSAMGSLSLHLKYLSIHLNIGTLLIVNDKQFKL